MKTLIATLLITFSISANASLITDCGNGREHAYLEIGASSVDSFGRECRSGYVGKSTEWLNWYCIRNHSGMSLQGFDYVQSCIRQPRFSSQDIKFGDIHLYSFQDGYLRSN